MKPRYGAGLKYKLQEVPVEQIDLGDRARRKYRNIGALSESIKQLGIIQPLTLVQQQVLGKPYRIVAGGRRLAAAKIAGLGKVPCLIYPATVPDWVLRRIELSAEKEKEALDWVEMEWLVREVRRLEALRGVDDAEEIPGDE